MVLTRAAVVVVGILVAVAVAVAVVLVMMRACVCAICVGWSCCARALKMMRKPSSFFSPENDKNIEERNKLAPAGARFVPICLRDEQL